ncbi:hypothetical protein LCGC14_2931710 [marine sediment metagenome]|uniref:Uncharacterized protein n=1 Tax=marine sediment metagenome TaxID=412755 RepID=A0A0F8ZTD3_9ZZZZ
MARAMRYLTILIFADLFFIATGQICSQDACGLGSIIFNAVLNLGSMPLTDLFSAFIGDALNLFSSATGIAALGVSGGVIIATFIATREFRVLLIPIALTLALIAGDFVIITSYLISLNVLLATFIMGPLSIIYVFTILEWLIGKD